MVVVGKGRDQVEAAIAGRDVDGGHPGRAKGHGHAVQQAAEALAGYDGAVLILYGDTPFVEADTLRRMLDRLDGQGGPGRGRARIVAGRSAEIRPHHPRRGRPDRQDGRV